MLVECPMRKFLTGENQYFVWNDDSRFLCKCLEPIKLKFVMCYEVSIFLTSLYYKRGEPYLCSAKAPVLDGSGSRR